MTFNKTKLTERPSTKQNQTNRMTFNKTKLTERPSTKQTKLTE